MTGYLTKPPAPVLNRGNPLSKGLVLAMPFNEKEGTAVYDHSGYGNHGVAGVALVKTNAIFGATNDFAGDGGEIESFVDIPASDSLSFGDAANDKPFSISVWIYRDTNVNVGIFGKDGQGGASDVEYDAVIHLNVIYFRLFDQPIAVGQEYVTLAWSTLNTWAHFVFTYDGRGGTSANDGLSIYKDGVLQSAGKGGAGNYVAMHASAKSLTIGKAFGNLYRMHGIIEHIYIYDRVLPQTEISLLYHDPFSAYRATDTFIKTFQTNPPIFWQIIDKLKVLINTYMTQANGFSLDYGSVDQYNPAARVYPAVFIEYPETDALEDFLQMIERDSETTDINIKVWAETAADLDKTANWIINDFGFLFDSFKNTLKDKGLEQYDLIDSVADFRNVSQYPVETVMTYRLKYRRKNDSLYTPDTTATPEVFSGSAFASSKPIIMRIIDDIETKIGSMTIANGYNFDYGSIDEYDPGSRTYPSVFLTYKEEAAGDEDEGMIGFYESLTSLQIKVSGVSGTTDDKNLFLVRSDFQKLFKDNFASFNGQGLGEARYQRTENNYRLVLAYPWEMILIYDLFHRRFKNNPYHA